MSKFDFASQEIHVGDYVVCTSSSSKTGMYVGKVTNVTEHKVQITAVDGKKHQKSFDKVLVITHQVKENPAMLI